MVQHRIGKPTRQAQLLLQQCQEDYRRHQASKELWLSNFTGVGGYGSETSAKEAEDCPPAQE